MLDKRSLDLLIDKYDPRGRYGVVDEHRIIAPLCDDDDREETWNDDDWKPLSCRVVFAHRPPHELVE